MAEYDGELMRCEVVGDLPIVDRVTNEDVLKGGVVQLDPAYTKIHLLVECGLVKVLADKPTAKPKE